MNLTEVTMTATTPVRTAPNALIDSRRRQPGDRSRQPVPDHAGLADREVDEHADGVQRDQQVGLAVEDRRSGPPRSTASTTIPHENASRSPRNENWRGMKPSLGEDREQPREGVEARVRGQEQQERRERLEQVERDRRRRRPGRATWEMTVCFSGTRSARSPKLRREERDPDEEDAEQGGHDARGSSRRSSTRAVERRHARGDRLGAGQGHGAGREGAQQQDRRQRLDACS